MADNEHDDQSRPRRISCMARSLADYCGEKQRDHAQIAQQFGYSNQVFRDMASYYSDVPDDPLYKNIEQSLITFDELLHTQEDEAAKHRFDFSSACYGIATASTSAMSVSMIHFGAPAGSHKIPEPPPHWPTNHTQVYADRLATLDPELGKLLRAVWQLFHSGAEDALRASLVSMRQLFDQFFELLAPDAEVRNSQFFNAKKGDKPDQVYRKERLHYATVSRVKDARLASLLQSQADQVVEVYNRLNILHSRKPLQAEEVKRILVATQAVIEQWADAIGLAKNS